MSQPYDVPLPFEDPFLPPDWDEEDDPCPCCPSYDNIHDYVWEDEDE